MKIGSYGFLIAMAAVVVGLAGCDSAKINGTVVDHSGRPLDNVSISITNTEFHTKTDSKGRYNLDYAPGQFQLMFEKKGYIPVSITLNLSTRSGIAVSQQALNYDVVPPFEKTINFITEKYIEYFKSHPQDIQIYQIDKLLQKTKSEFLANLRRVKFPGAMIDHVMKFPTGSTLVMAVPAYIKLGLPVIIDLANEGSSGPPFKIPADAKEYVELAFGSEKIIDEAISGSLDLNDSRFLAATDARMVLVDGFGLIGTSVLIGSITEIGPLKFKDVGQFRKSIEAKRTEKSKLK